MIVQGMRHGLYAEPIHIPGHTTHQCAGQWTIARSRQEPEKAYLISEDATDWKLWRWDGQKITSEKPVRIHKRPWNKPTEKRPTL